jgi:RNA-directed DNA polymerase
MSNTKAPRTKPEPQLDPESESWHMVPWRKLEQYVYRLQKRIFRASQQGNMLRLTRFWRGLKRGR